MGDEKRAENRGRSARLWHILLLVPFVGTLWVPFYNAVEPRLGGVPYFYWYQFLWIPIGAGITALVYFATREKKP
jgi:hypothetical protein